MDDESRKDNRLVEDIKLWKSWTDDKRFEQWRIERLTVKQ